MSALRPSSFYLKPPPGPVGIVKFGPFPLGSLTNPGAQGVLANALRPITSPQAGAVSLGGCNVRNSTILETMHRGARFPGVLQVERPARGAIDCPAAAAITDLSTLSIGDGASLFVWTFYRTTPFVPGPLNVDLTGATTPEQVAIAFVTATNLFFVPGPSSGNFIVGRTGAQVRIVQAGRPKTLQSAVPGENVQNMTWLTKTLGVFGNGPITPSAPGDWTGRIVNMAGGKYRRPGVLGVASSPKRAQWIPLYLAAITLE